MLAHVYCYQGSNLAHGPTGIKGFVDKDGSNEITTFVKNYGNRLASSSLSPIDYNTYDFEELMVNKDSWKAQIIEVPLSPVHTLNCLGKADYRLIGSYVNYNAEMGTGESCYEFVMRKFTKEELEKSEGLFKNNNKKKKKKKMFTKSDKQKNEDTLTSSS